MMHHMYEYGSSGGYGYGSIWMIFFWVILIAFCAILIGLGIYLLTKLVNSSNKKAKENHYTSNYVKELLQTLKERLAKGEIDEAEYERLKLIIEWDKG